MNITTLTHWASANSPGSYIGAAVAGLVVLMLVYAGIRALRRWDLADVITVVIALAATAYAGTGTWKYLDEAMHYSLDLKVFLVAVLEGAQIAEALRARKNIKESGAAGVDGVGLWVLTGISAALSTSVAGNVREALGRAVVPLVGAWLWERALAPQRRAAKARRTSGPVRWRITPERVFVWLRLADAVDTDVMTVDSARRVAKFLRVTDRVTDGFRWPFTPKARAYRGRMKLIGDALRHGDPAEVHSKLSQAAFADALSRLGIGPEQAAEALPDGESPAESDGESHTSDGSFGVSQNRSLLLPGDSAFKQVEANLPPALVHPVNGRPKVAAASAPARRQATITARIGGTDRDKIARLWKASQAAGTPLSTRALARRAGVSQSTVVRVVAELQDVQG